MMLIHLAQKRNWLKLLDASSGHYYYEDQVCAFLHFSYFSRFNYLQLHCRFLKVFFPF